MSHFPGSGVSSRCRSGALLVLIVLFVALPALAAGEARLDALEIEMDPLDAEVLFKKERYDLSSFPVRVIDNGQKLTGRIEVKGSFTRRFSKRSLLIKLDPGQSWKGQRRISLNAMATDESLMRERLAWQLIHDLKMVAPAVRYQRLMLNNQYIGLFLQVEWIDTVLFARYGLGGDGEFFHPLDEFFCGDLSAASVERPERCWIKLAPKNDDYSALQSLARDIEAAEAVSFHEFVERAFDADSLIDWMVANSVTSNGDTYHKNYFLYRSTNTRKWTVVPFDYDLTFGRNWDPYLTYPKTILNPNFQYFYPLELGAPSPLKDKILNNPVLLQRVKQRLREVLAGEPSVSDPARGWFRPDIMLRRIDDLYGAIRDDVRSDRYMAARIDDFEEQVGALKYYAVARAQYLRRVVVGETDWNRDHVTIDLIKQGATGYFTDGWGYLLGMLTPRALTGPARVSLEVERNAPGVLPEGIRPESCVQRTWYLTVKTPNARLRGDITLEYIEENSKNRELGAQVRDERVLVLWMLSETGWQRLPTRVNAYANILHTENLDVPAARLLRFVACLTPGR